MIVKKKLLRDEKNLLHSNIFQTFSKKKNLRKLHKNQQTRQQLKKPGILKNLDHLILLMSSLI